MKVVFFATPDFAVPILDTLINSKHTVVSVVTNTDKEQGRGKKIAYSPIKEFAIKNNLPVLQPESFKDPLFIEQLKKLDADVYIVVAFKILPKEVYSLPKHGTFNLHGSLLPKYRGAAPIQWALINGDTKTGLTTFFLRDKVDTGNMILKDEIDIDPEDDFGSLHDKMSNRGAKLVQLTLELIESVRVQQYEQDDSVATPAPKITKETCKIDWNKKAIEIHNLVRGVSPFPGAYFEKEQKIYKVFKTKVVENKNLGIGEILTTKNEIFIGCNDSTLQILIIQPEGRKRMNADEFLRGYKF